MAMLNEKQVSLFIEKMRQRTAQDPSLGQAIVKILEASVNEDVKEPADEIAKTLCEILEPERIGGIVWKTCKLCKERLGAEEVENKVDTCFSCRVTGGLV